MTIDLHQIQNTSADWRNGNFDHATITPLYQLLGVMEEVGELSHAELKHAQKIRGMENDDEFMKAARDAVGDIVIFLMGYCSTRGIDLESAIEQTWDGVKQRDWQYNPWDGSSTAVVDDEDV